MKTSKWIWKNSEYEKDIYCEFLDTFNFDGKDAKLEISSDSTYVVYLNGEFVDLGQYPDFPWYKVYDEIDLTPYCKQGKNTLAIAVWHFGNVEHYSYYPGNASLRYEVYGDGKLIAESSENTLSRISPTYQNGLCRFLTGQIRFSYSYDFTKEDNWINGEGDGFEKSDIVEQDLPMFIRPIKKMDIGKEPIKSTYIEGAEGPIFDLGREETGYLTFTIDSPVEQTILVVFDEIVRDNKIIYLKSCNRNYSYEFKLRKGKNTYFNPFLRCGTRYLGVISKTPVKVEMLSLVPAYYTFTKAPYELPDELDRRIYDVCAHTLEVCAHDHYEDTPYREQALYALDSRNQMLCGYYAFKEYAFPRSNLLLMSKDRREDGLLNITCPTGSILGITTFALFYIIQTYEYTVHSKDITLIEETYPRLETIIKVFLSLLEDNLIRAFRDKYQWNFYEWRDGLDGKLLKEDDDKFDTAMNCLLVIALRLMHKMGAMLGKTDNYDEIAENIRKEIYKKLYDKERKVFVNSSIDDRASDLVNALAILSDAIVGEEAVALAHKLGDKDNGFTPISLSMIGFKYDALIKACGNEYNDYILSNIRTEYKKMLDDGATSFWEYDYDYVKAKDEAGSKSHGWSAMPICYYHVLNYTDKTPKYYE